MAEFRSLRISPGVLQNIHLMGFSEMTPIQEMVLPAALNGSDIIGQAKTGTGKTLAFSIPIVEKIRFDDKSVQALILTPTRELTVQVGEELGRVAGSSTKVALVYGGASMNTQTEALRRGAHVVVGTPGRVIDLIERGNLKLGAVKTLVLDEADRMLDMGFIKDVEWILEKTPATRQTMLFSATMPEQIRTLAEKHLRNPEYISASSDSDELTIGDVQQYYVEVDQKRKMDAFLKVIEEERPSKALIFCKTKRWGETFYGILMGRGFKVDRIHGDLSQSAREKAVDRLRSGEITFLVCTDVAARGLDIQDITHVFNYDLPQEPLTYVHRVGRTARAGKKGTAITFLNPDQMRDLWLVEHHARTKLQKRDVNLGLIRIVRGEAADSERRFRSCAAAGRGGGYGGGGHRHSNDRGGGYGGRGRRHSGGGYAGGSHRHPGSEGGGGGRRHSGGGGGGYGRGERRGKPRGGPRRHGGRGRGGGRRP